MPEDFISKIAKYVAFLYRGSDVLKHQTRRIDTADLFMTKVEAVRDICTIFGCREEVWSEALKIYQFVGEK